MAQPRDLTRPPPASASPICLYAVADAPTSLLLGMEDGRGFGNHTGIHDSQEKLYSCNTRSRNRHHLCLAFLHRRIQYRPKHWRRVTKYERMRHHRTKVGICIAAGFTPAWRLLRIAAYP